jgi:hypothetical protein
MNALATSYLSKILRQMENSTVTDGQIHRASSAIILDWYDQLANTNRLSLMKALILMRTGDPEQLEKRLNNLNHLSSKQVTKVSHWILQRLAKIQKTANKR